MVNADIEDMKIDDTLEDLLPRTLTHVRLSLILFYTAAAIAVIGVFAFLLFQDNIDMKIFTILSLLYMTFALAMTYFIRHERKTGNEETIKFFQKWASDRYDISLDEEQARTLIEPTGYRNLKKRYVSEALEVWTEDELNRKHLQTLRLFKTPEDGFIIMHMESSTELMTRIEQEEIIFFQTLWNEVRNNGGLYGLYDQSQDELELVNVQKDADKVALLWSDPLRAELYNSGNVNHKIIHIEFPVFLQQVLPQQARKGMLLGLNWGEEQRVYPTEKITQLMQ